MILDLRINAMSPARDGRQVFSAGVCGETVGLGVYHEDPVECAKIAMGMYFKAYPSKLQSLQTQARALCSKHEIEPALVQSLPQGDSQK